MNDAEIWIGLIGAQPRDMENAFGSLEGGFVNALAIVSDSNEFATVVRTAIGELGLEVESIEDVEPLSERLKGYCVENEIVEIAQTMKRYGEVRFATFYTYDIDRN